jgi:anti-sigma regulatory factor (Ser/Thr protein kinase)
MWDCSYGCWQLSSAGIIGFLTMLAAGSRIAETCSVLSALDVVAVRSAARRCAAKLGFPRNAIEEIAIVVSELASNILKYGPTGHIVIESVSDPEHGPGLRIEAFDRGPPFRNIDLALRDGFHDAGPIDPDQRPRRVGIGAGLGAVRRFTDSFEYEVQSQGKRITVVRYLRGVKRRPAR